MQQECSGINALSGEAVVVRFGQVIEGVEPLLGRTPPDVLLAPGFIDIQVNGFAGVDYNSPGASQEGIARSLEAQFACGVTRLLPTVITGGREEMRASLENLARARAALRDGEAMEGYHVEGPHICPDDGPRGAHPRHCVRPPDLDEYRRWQEAADGRVKLVTLSPEWPEAPGYIEALVRDGVAVSIGHTKASAEQIQDAVAAGATLSTHIGNGAHFEMRRHPNYIWEQLAEDRLTASFIVDGIHLGPAFLKTALRAKGVQRSILITDAVMPAGCEPGPYFLGEVAVELRADRSVVLRGGDRLAGSSLHMHDGVANLMRMAGLSLREAVTMATRNPARGCRIAGRQRGLEPGERGDLVAFRLDEASGRIEVLRTWLGGRQVYCQAGVN